MFLTLGSEEMDTTSAIILLVVIYILYVLLVKGLLWKIILGVFGWLGMYWYLSGFPALQSYPLDNNTFTWATTIPSLIILLAMLYTKEN